MKNIYVYIGSIVAGLLLITLVSQQTRPETKDTQVVQEDTTNSTEEDVGLTQEHITEANKPEDTQTTPEDIVPNVTTATEKETTMLDTVNSTTFSKYNTEEERTIIDVRTPEEYASGHIEHAKNIDFYDPTFTEQLNSLDKTASYSIYCRSGNRSGQTLDIMTSLGFTNVIDLQGGIQTWVAASKSLCTSC